MNLLVRTVIIWRETQWQWLSDSVAAGRVVHTAWGEPDEWLRFGTTDCNTDAPLPLPGPQYALTEDLCRHGKQSTSLVASDYAWHDSSSLCWPSGGDTLHWAQCLNFILVPFDSLLLKDRLAISGFLATVCCASHEFRHAC